MKYKRVKKMDYDFSVIGYGCWGASGKGSWSNHSDTEQIKAMETAIDYGVNFFDVAPVYGLGYAEEILGKAIKGKRDKIFVATKTGLPWNEKYEVRNDVAKESILKEIDDSLHRLNLEYVDLYQVHWPTASNVSIEETMEAMRMILESGKTKYVGLTNYSVVDAKEAMKYVDIASMQGLYNMIEQNADSYHGIPLDYQVANEILPFVKENGMAFYPYSPLFQGMLAGAITNDTVFGKNDVRNSNPKLNGEERTRYLAVMDQIKLLSNKIGRPLNEIALNYLIEKEEVTSIIAGVQNSEQVIGNIKSLEWTMTSDVINEIDHLVTKAV